MRRSIVAAVGVLTAVLLTGCSSDDEPDAGTPAAPVALPGASALPSLPAGGADAAAAPAGGTGSPAAPVTGTVTARPTQTVVAPHRTDRAGPPAGGTDSLQSTWVTATVTRGGSGPCYGITTSDGVAWALYADNPVKLVTGAGIRTRVTPGKTPVDCGAGRSGLMGRVQLAE